MNNVKKIIAVDFDRTLMLDDYPNFSRPNMRLIDFINNNRNKYIFILNTCRYGKELNHIVTYLKMKFGLTFDYINENVSFLIKKYGDTRKIYADYYIDDKNLTLDSWYKILS